MIDTHCHLNFEAFSNDVDEVIKRAEEIGVTKFIVPGAKMDSSEKAFELSQQYGNVFAAVGFHPHHVDEFSERSFLKLKDLIKNDKVVAVGEIGLDLHNYTHKGVSDLNLQKNILKQQLDLAVEFDKPCILHCREAYDEIDNFLEEYLKDHKSRGVFHCFSGDLEHLKRVLAMGFYVSFTGNVTYDGSYDLLIKNTPLKKLLLETDSPFLAPNPLRGRRNKQVCFLRNEPKNILAIVKYIAGIKNIGLKELIERSTINAEELFSLC